MLPVRSLSLVPACFLGVSLSVSLIVSLGFVPTPVYASPSAGRGPKHGLKGDEHHSEKTCADVSVDIRALQGFTSVAAAQERASAAKKPPLKLGKKLRDLKPKLEKLSYDSYKLLTRKKEIIPLTSKKVVMLGGGHRLTLRPLYVKKKRVGMWMRWKDPNGLKIIDTRMHFDCGEQMLTGMEENAERGLILAIQVDPYYRQ